MPMPVGCADQGRLCRTYRHGSPREHGGSQQGDADRRHQQAAECRQPPDDSLAEEGRERVQQKPHDQNRRSVHHRHTGPDQQGIAPGAPTPGEIRRDERLAVAG
ncbi:MAG: hypothetical protein M3228_01190 [Actinomycetota bacterium]|nr:hypothetical protein [Actinomycetota bacterium]